MPRAIEQDIDGEHPRLSYAEALAKVRSTGYVRMDGHTATNVEQLDELFHAIFPAKDAGTYSQPRDYAEALKEAKAEEAKEAAVVTGAVPADVLAENEALKARIAALEAAAPAEQTPTDATGADAAQTPTKVGGTEAPKAPAAPKAPDSK